jgi:hypothetical protein
VRTRHFAALLAVCLAGLVLAPGQAAAVPPPIRCDLTFTTQPRTDDFIVHSTGQVSCDAVASRISGTIALYRDGARQGDLDFGADDSATTDPATVKVMPPCVPGSYQATLDAKWWNEFGAERSDSAASEVVDITC